jgi:hypothetical protein
METLTRRNVYLIAEHTKEDIPLEEVVKVLFVGRVELER